MLKLSPVEEKQFQRHFQEESLDSFILGMTLSAFCSWLAVVLFYVFTESHPTPELRQTLRLALGILLTIPIVLFYAKPNWLKTHLALIKSCLLVAISCLLLMFAMTNDRPEITNIHLLKMIATVAVTAWMMYTLFRLKPWLITAAQIPFWSMFVYTLIKMDSAQNAVWTIWFIAVMLVIGWFGNKRIEDRERLVFKQRIELEKRLDHIKTLMSNTEKSNAGIRHDVRQPVWAMSLYLGALQEDIDNPKKRTEVKEYVMRLFQCLQSIDQTVDRIAATKGVTKEEPAAEITEINPNSDDDDEPIDEDDASSALTQVNLQPVFSKLDAIFSAVAKARNVQLRFVCKQAPMVISNEAILQDTLANLISNAIKFAAPVARPAWVVVHCHVSRNEVRIAIADNGVGIAKEEQQKIFQPYYQIGEAGSEHAEHPTSEGLGLSMVERNIAQLPDHRLTLYSNHNQGTCFKLYLPRS